MHSLIYTLPHASSFDIHKSNLHFPCSVLGKNLIVTTKRRLEYPEHINVPVQTVPQEDSEKVGLRVDNQAQLWPENDDVSTIPPNQVCAARRLGLCHLSVLVCDLLSRMSVYLVISWKVGPHRSGALC